MPLVLVTGGLGFLGSHIVRQFADAGFEVRILNRQGRRPPDFRHPQGWPITWADIRDVEAVDRAVARVDVVVHTVSNFREARTDHEAFPINVEGTDNVLRAAARGRIKRFVLCSTIGVHGDVREVPASENTAFNPGDVYQQTKVVAENHARTFERESGIPVCILRPTSLYGPGDLRMLKLFRMIQRHTFVMMGRGRSYFHPGYIDDVAAAFVLGATHEAAAGETFIIGGEGYLTLAALIERIAAHLGVSPPWLRLPLAPMEWAARACELACRPFGIEPPLHRRRMSFFRNNRAFSIEKARRVLGYSPAVSLDEGLERTIHWYEVNGYLAPRHPGRQALDPAAASDQLETAPANDHIRSSH